MSVSPQQLADTIRDYIRLTRVNQDSCCPSRPDTFDALDVLVRRLQEAEAALRWIQEFAAKTNEHGIVHTGFTHVERRARSALAAGVPAAGDTHGR